MKTGDIQKCLTCGKDFVWRKGHRTKFCSPICYATSVRKGPRVDTSNGYVRVNVGRTHPLAHGDCNAAVHWLVMYEQSPLGKEKIVQLKKEKWTIHHKNGKRADNRLSNLELRAPSRHPFGWSLDEMARELLSQGYRVEAPK